MAHDYNEAELKAEALRLAHNTFEPANVVIDRAEEYLKFLSSPREKEARRG